MKMRNGRSGSPELSRVALYPAIHRGWDGCWNCQYERQAGGSGGRTIDDRSSMIVVRNQQTEVYQFPNLTSSVVEIMLR
jgi:hypothetical protein